MDRATAERRTLATRAVLIDHNPAAQIRVSPFRSRRCRVVIGDVAHELTVEQLVSIRDQAAAQIAEVEKQEASVLGTELRGTI